MILDLLGGYDESGRPLSPLYPYCGFQPKTGRAFSDFLEFFSSRIFSRQASVEERGKERPVRLLSPALEMRLVGERGR